MNHSLQTVFSDALPRRPLESDKVERIALGDIHTKMLIRDRFTGFDPELENLATSIKDIGLSNPIRVVRRPDGDGVELVQGYRRLNAHRALLEETGDDHWAAIPALVVTGAADIDGLYRQMVDENVIRKDISFAEMARAAQIYAMDPGTTAQTLRDAVATLFQSAPYSKRSYIRSFAFMLDEIGEVLLYPSEVPRMLGVSLAQALEENPDLKTRIGDDLRDWDGRSILDELDVLRRHIGQPAVAVGGEVDLLPHQGAIPPKRGTRLTGTKTIFDLSTSAGRARCFAQKGSLTIKVARNFPALDQARLERAIAGFIDGL